MLNCAIFFTEFIMIEMKKKKMKERKKVIMMMKKKKKKKNLNEWPDSDKLY